MIHRLISFLKNYFSSSQIKTDLLVLFAGYLSVFAFAPYRFDWLLFLTLMLFIHVILQTSTLKAILKYFGLFGLGFFGGGTYWVYISIHTFAEAPLIVTIFLTGFFILLGTSYFILNGAIYYYLSRWLKCESEYDLKSIALFAFCWNLTDYIRHLGDLGLPWLLLGYSQVPQGLFASLVPVIGVIHLSFVLILFSGWIYLLLFNIYTQFKLYKLNKKIIYSGLIYILYIDLLIGSAFYCSQIEWVKPIDNSTLKVSLLQGNVTQSLKFDPQEFINTLDKYQKLIENNLSSDLIILPETAYPVLYSDMPDDYMRWLKNISATSNKGILFGIPEQDSSKRYYNSAYLFYQDKEQVYRKIHLVPFGEFFPFKWIVQPFIDYFLKIPFSDFSRGETHSTDLNFKDLKLSISICYEDVFSIEWLSRSNHSDILINMSNDAWFGTSIALDQHLQIAQARALEAGRYLLRSTNTGHTVIINPKGEIIQRIPANQIESLTAKISIVKGQTPYMGLISRD